MQEQGYDNHIKTVMAPAAKLLLYGRLARVSISPMDVMGFSLNGTVEYCRNHGSHQLSFGQEGGRGGSVPAMTISVNLTKSDGNGWESLPKHKIIGHASDTHIPTHKHTLTHSLTHRLIDTDTQRFTD